MLDENKLLSIEFLVSDLPRIKFNLNPRLYKIVDKSKSSLMTKAKSKLSVTSRKSSLERLLLLSNDNEELMFPEAVETSKEIVVKARSRKNREKSCDQSATDGTSLNDLELEPEPEVQTEIHEETVQTVDMEAVEESIQTDEYEEGFESDKTEELEPFEPEIKGLDVDTVYQKLSESLNEKKHTIVPLESEISDPQPIIAQKDEISEELPPPQFDKPGLIEGILKGSTSFLESTIGYVGDKFHSLPHLMPRISSADDRIPFEEQEFEIVKSHSASPIQLPKTVELNVCPIIGLAKQKYRCVQCRKHIGMNMFLEARLCDISGFYFCPDCHQNDLSVSPARIVNNWDFQPVKVSKKLFHHVDESKGLPYIDLEKRNPVIFNFVTELQKVKSLREELFITKEFIMTCKMETKHSLLKMIWPREHLVNCTDLYSLEDLLEVQQETLSKLLHNISIAYKRHILTQCELCVLKGSYCEFCKSDEIIYPFDFSKTIRCMQCNSLSHRRCYKGPSSCPKCMRMRTRQAHQ